MKFDSKRSSYNINTREFAVRDIDGKIYAVGYPIYFCTKVHPCRTGIRENMGCSRGDFTKEQWLLCPGRNLWYDSKREMTEEEIKQMFNQEDGWTDIREYYLEGEE